MSRYTFLFLLGLLAVFAAPLPAADPPEGESSDSGRHTIQNAAMVNGEPIPYEKFVEGLVKRHGKQYLDELIIDKLLQQEFDKHGIKATDEEVNAEIRRDVDKQLVALDRQSQQVNKMSLSEWLLRQESSLERKRKAMIDERNNSLDIFAKEVKADKLIGYFLLQRTRVSVRQIQTKTRKEAEEVLAMIKDPDQPQTFDSVWKEMMGNVRPDLAEIHPFARNDYKLQNVRGELDFLGPRFSQEAFSLKPGDPSEVFHGKRGWHIIKVMKVYPAHQGPYSGEIKEQVEKTIRGGERPAQIDYDTWIALKRADKNTKIDTDPELEELLKKK